MVANMIGQKRMTLLIHTYLNILDGFVDYHIYVKGVAVIGAGHPQHCQQHISCLLFRLFGQHAHYQLDRFIRECVCAIDRES